MKRTLRVLMTILLASAFVMGMATLETTLNASSNRHQSLNIFYYSDASLTTLVGTGICDCLGNESLTSGIRTNFDRLEHRSFCRPF